MQSESSEGSDSGAESEPNSESVGGGTPAYPGIESMVHFFTKGASFDLYKSNFREFVNPVIVPDTLQRAIFKGLRNVHKVLDKHFDTVAQDQFAWLHMLVESGYSYEEIAELLIDKEDHSSWIHLESETQLQFLSTREWSGTVRDWGKG
jgi:hypothetical protein